MLNCNSLLHNNFFKSYVEISQGTWKLLFGGFVNAMSISIPIYISLYLNMMGYNLEKIGNLLAIYGLFGIIGGYIGGILSDKISAITVCKFSLIVSSLFFSIFPFTNGSLQLIPTLSIIGFSTNLFRPAFILAVIENSSLEDLERSIAIRRVAINIGMAFGAAICGIISVYSYALVFFFVSISSILAFLILKNIAPSKYNSSSKTKENQNKDSNKFKFYMMLFALGGVLLIFNQSQSLYPLYLKNTLFFNSAYISGLFALNGLLVALFQVPLSGYFSKKNKYVTCLLGAIFIFLGFGSISWVSSFPALLLSCFIWTMGEMIFFPAHMAMLMRLEAISRGKAMGIYQLVYSSSLFYSPVFGMYLYNYRPNIVWNISILLSLIVVIQLVYFQFKYKSLKQFKLVVKAI